MNFNENSEEFKNVATYSGHLKTTCGCGRIHFSTTNEEWDENELKNLKGIAEKNKDAYFSTDNEFVHLCNFGGMLYVQGCPCMQLLELEKFVWSARKEIMAYYVQVQAKMKRENLSLDQIITSLDELFANKGNKLHA